MSAIDRATAHFSLYKTRTIEVPEWGEGEGIVAPLIIYCPPITLAQKQRISNYADSMGVMEETVNRLRLKVPAVPFV
jgi:hypothetical protein